MTSTREARRSGTLPRRHRDRGSSARARPGPGDEPRPAPPRSRPDRSRHADPGLEELHGTDLERAHGAAGRREILRRLERLVERRALDDVEAEELLLGLGERTVDDPRLLA